MHLYTIGTRGRICGLSTEFLSVPVPWQSDPSSYIDTPVQPNGNLFFAFTAPGVQPGPTDWVAGSWGASGSDYYGAILIGPENGVQLDVGYYEVWARIINPPENVIQPLGGITIF